MPPAGGRFFLFVPVFFLLFLQGEGIGIIDDLPISQVLEFRDGLMAYLRDSYGKLLDHLREEKIQGEVEEQLKQAITDYKSDFVAKHAAASAVVTETEES